MKTKMIFKDFQIHNVSMERVEFDVNEKNTLIFLDDVNEKRWVIKTIVEQALKITTIDCVSYEHDDIDKDCFVAGEDFPIFRRHILEVENSEWIKELKATLKKVDPNADFMDKARHFLLPLYDNQIEIIAWDIELEEVKESN